MNNRVINLIKKVRTLKSYDGVREVTTYNSIHNNGEVPLSSNELIDYLIDAKCLEIFGNNPTYRGKKVEKEILITIAKFIIVELPEHVLAMTTMRCALSINDYLDILSCNSITFSSFVALIRTSMYPVSLVVNNNGIKYIRYSDSDMTGDLILRCNGQIWKNEDGETQTHKLGFSVFLNYQSGQMLRLKKKIWNHPNEDNMVVGGSRHIFGMLWTKAEFTDWLDSVSMTNIFKHQRCTCMRRYGD